MDCVERGGLGFRPAAGAPVFERLGVSAQRTETITLNDAYKDLAYSMDVWLHNEKDRSCCQAVGRSVLDQPHPVL